MTLIAATADFHGKFPSPDDIPRCDILVVAGDFGARPEEILRWLDSLPSCEIVTVTGNVDYQLQRGAWNLPWTLLNDEADTIAGVEFYGASGMDIGDEWRASGIPVSTEVLVTHVPPLGILDEVTPGEHIGDRALRDEILEARELMLHLFGHCHEQAGKTHQERGITFANCGYLGRHLPMVFEI